MQKDVNIQTGEAEEANRALRDDLTSIGELQRTDKTPAGFWIEPFSNTTSVASVPCFFSACSQFEISTSGDSTMSGK